MKRIYSRTMLGVAAAIGVLVVSSPAFAVTWQCTAQNARGANYTSSATGLYTNVVRDRARDRAIAKCRSNSLADVTCHITSCTPTN